MLGTDLATVRFLPALIGALIVALTGWCAVELGGRAIAAFLASFAVLCAPAMLSTDHTWSMISFDHFLWIGAAIVMVRTLKNPTPRAWLALGLVLGLGLQNKWSVLWLGAGLSVGILFSSARRWLRTPWPYVAAALASVLLAPNLLWQLRNHWPTLEFMHHALTEKYVSLSVGDFARSVLLIMNPLSMVLAFAGLWRAFEQRREHDGAFVLAVAFLITLLILLVSSGAKPEYLIAAFPMLFACGAVQLEIAWYRLKRRRFAIALVAAYAFLLSGFAALIAPVALPILNEAALVRYQAALGLKPVSSEKKEQAALPQHFADMHGWPELTAAVAAVWRTLSPAQREHATLWVASGGYGPAAALDFFGPAYGLPAARSSHNNYWRWGPGDGDGEVVVVVGGDAIAAAVRVARARCRLRVHVVHAIRKSQAHLRRSSYEAVTRRALAFASSLRMTHAPTR